MGANGWINRAALTLIFLGIPGCFDGAGDAGPKGTAEAVPVAVEAARADGVQRTVVVVGTLFGQEDVVISNKVPGKVIAIYKDIGDRVAPGEVLAQLLKNDYQLTLNERQSSLQEALAALGLDDVPAERFDAEAVPAVRRAKLQAQNAANKLDRARPLHESRPPLISDQDYADLQTESQVAQSGYEAAVLEARAQVGLARTRKAQVAIAEQALRDTTIRAPRPMTNDEGGDGAPASASAGAPAAPGAAGTLASPGAAGAQPTADASDTKAAVSPAGPSFAVAARFSSEGELNAGLTRMFRLVIDDSLKLRANVPERHAGEIHVGQKVLVKVEAESREFPGTVARINPQIDAASRAFAVEVAVPNPNHLLKPGAFAQAEIKTFVQPDVLLVPARAVVSFAGVKKVYAVRDGKAVEIPIETGVNVGDWAEVVKSKELKPGDPVVVQGVNRMSSGTAVVVAPDGH